MFSISFKESSVEAKQYWHYDHVKWEQADEMGLVTIRNKLGVSQSLFSPHFVLLESDYKLSPCCSQSSDAEERSTDIKRAKD